jgi:hypothetical protein
MSSSDPLGKLWEWFIGTILLLVFGPAIVSMLLRAVLQVLSEVLGSLLGVLVLVLVGYGLFTKVVGSRLTNLRAERERRVEEQFIRQSARHSASDIPLREHRGDVDEDPALNAYDDGRAQ